MFLQCERWDSMQVHQFETCMHELLYLKKLSHHLQLSVLMMVLKQSCMHETDKVRNLLHSVNCFFHQLACLPMLVMICLLSLVTLSPELCATIKESFLQCSLFTSPSQYEQFKILERLPLVPWWGTCTALDTWQDSRIFSDVTEQFKTELAYTVRVYQPLQSIMGRRSWCPVCRALSCEESCAICVQLAK